MNYKENDKGAELFQEHFHLFLEKLCAFNPPISATRYRLLYDLQDLFLSGCTLPLPAEKNLLHGSLWHGCLGSLPAESSEILLRTEYDCICSMRTG